ncbi:MAG TPA: beta-ketoacyl-ACP synthase III [Stellaceae bacterium]|jgi:3-oxoacyl-[acyl-carrier-protein] synthase-3|nr:beta-ketoacyl-ACP synthase III [Stellaceae bacterium]
MILRSQVAGCGAYLPKRIIGNRELADRLDTSDEWIRQRTGIGERRVAAPGELTSDLAFRAAQRALASAGMSGSDLDLLVLATATPDNTFPATAAKVQARLGMMRGAAFDVQAVCAGFIFALSVADNALRLGQARTALVIGAETFSRILDWEDRGTCVLFGDGAGALVLKAVSGPGPTDSSPRGRFILSNHLHSDGRQYDILYVDGGPSSTQATGFLRMQGREVFRQAVQRLSEVIDETLRANNLTGADIDWLVPHQANSRIIDAMGRKLGLPPDKIVMTIERHANTSAASIPLALEAAVDDGRIKPGHLVLMEALGGGLSWGASLVRW